MTLAIIQFLLCSFAAFGLYMLWRRIAPSAGRPVFWLITAGLLIRAVGGQLAFWISYLHLPIARSLQAGRGIWIFAIDALGYFDTATAAAHHGPAAILFLPRTLGSVFYVQVLATALLAFGTVASVGILLNVAAYLGTCAMALKLAGSPRNPNRTVVFAIGVLSLSPSVLMWSVQPLKDTVFLFLVAAFFVAAYLWQRVWAGREGARQILRGVAATVGVALLVYAISAIRWYFGMAIVIASVPFVIATVVRGQRRLAAAVTGIILIPLLGVMFFSGAGPYVPPAVQRAVLGRDIRQKAELPNALLTTVNDLRTGFDKSAGATMIGAGDAIKKIDDTLGAKETRVAATRPPDTIYQTARPGAIRVGMDAPSLREPDEGGTSGGTVLVPASPLTRLAAGTAALILPRSIAQRLGILNVGGGRGLWIFVEIDTVAFDIVLIFAIVAVAGAIRHGALRAPVFWMVLLVTGAIGVSLAYTVSNFGTLFRHRDMVLLGLTFLPLAAWSFASMEIPAGERSAAWKGEAAEPLHA